MRKTTPKGIFLLLLTSLIWGASFVAQKVGMESIDAFTFTAIRTTLGVIVILPVMLLINRKFYTDKNTLFAGVVLGIDFAIAQNFQQFAFYYSEPGKIAFITAFYIFLVPLFSLFLHKKVRALTWVAIFFGLIGMFFLCINPQNLTAINKGDILALCGAVFFAMQITLIDYYIGQDVNGIQLSFMQFVVAALISIIGMLAYERPDINAITVAMPSLLYSGVMSCGVAYTLQIVGQKHASPVVASLIMCLESVVAVITAAVMLHQLMSLREAMGCVIMFAAIILSNIAESIPQVKGSTQA